MVAFPCSQVLKYKIFIPSDPHGPIEFDEVELRSSGPERGVLRGQAKRVSHRRKEQYSIGHGLQLILTASGFWSREFGGGEIARSPAREQSVNRWRHSG